MSRCTCTRQHDPRRVVLTGGPGAGKTAVLEMLAHEVCSHVLILPEAAGIVFGGGFPRGADELARVAAQRAIFAVQLELERVAGGVNAALTLCDRGLADGFAYWPGPDDFWTTVGMTRAEILARYQAVIHLRVPGGGNGYGHTNPLRTETATEAAEIDRRILEVWQGHPRRFIIDATPDFLAKARRVLDIIRGEIPTCCRRPESPAVQLPLAG